jgi:hypothetical protein
MALLFVDGFEPYGTSAGSAPVGRANKWSGPSTGDHDSTTIIAGRFDGFAIRPSSNDSNFCHLPTPRDWGQLTDLVCGVAFRIETMPSNYRELIMFRSNTSADEVGVAVLSTGALRVFRQTADTGGGGVALEDTATGLIEANKWYYLEFKAHIANSPNGSYVLHLDGAEVAEATGVDTQTSQAWADHVRLVGRQQSGSNNSTFVAYDDFYFLSGTGSPTDFLGPRHVYTIFPTAAGDDAEFTPSAGNNHEAVDDNGHDTDSTYIESNVENGQDLYQFGNLPTGVTDVEAVVVYGIVRKTDVSSFDFIGMAKSNGTEESASSFFVDTQSYIAAPGVFLTDPDTDAAWTEAGINAAQFGLKVGF